MKKKIIIIASIFLAALLTMIILMVVIPEMNYEDIRNMQINNVDLSKMEDGTYNGAYKYGHYTYQVEVTISDHEITKVKVIDGRKSKHAIAAEGVIDSVIAEQKIDVDAVSGATTTSKAILKAIENALSQ